MRFKTSFLIGFSGILGSWFYVNDNIITLSYRDIFIKISTVFLLVLFSSGSLNLFNDIIDLKIDKELKPERILVQGLVSIQNAYIFFILLIVFCLLLSISLNFIVFIIYIIMLIVGIFYSLLLENIPLLKNFIVAFSISMSILVGYLSFLNKLILNLSNHMVIIFGLSICSILAFELQKDINDVDIDRKYHKMTFPVVFGKKNSAILVYVFYWFIAIIFWIYLLFVSINTTIYLAIPLIGIQLIILLSLHNIMSNQSYEYLEKARIRAYSLFFVTLIALFFLK